MTKATITNHPDPSTADMRLRNLPRGVFSPDALTDILRSGARRLIEQAVEAELAVLHAAHTSETTQDGRARLVL